MNEYKDFLKEVKAPEMKKWRNEKQSIAVGIIETFSDSEMQMAEIDLDKLPEPEPKEKSNFKSTKQDSFASSFYAWKKKGTTKQKLAEKGIDILLIRRGDKIALKKKECKQ
jgi:hypothetical protein